MRVRVSVSPLLIIKDILLPSTKLFPLLEPTPTPSPILAAQLFFFRQPLSHHRISAIGVCPALAWPAGNGASPHIVPPRSTSPKHYQWSRCFTALCMAQWWSRALLTFSVRYGARGYLCSYVWKYLRGIGSGRKRGFKGGQLSATLCRNLRRRLVVATKIAVEATAGEFTSVLKRSIESSHRRDLCTDAAAVASACAEPKFPLLLERRNASRANLHLIPIIFVSAFFAISCCYCWLFYTAFDVEPVFCTLMSSDWSGQECWKRF